MPSEYEPLDLSGFCNGGPEILPGAPAVRRPGDPVPPESGAVVFHGLPFQIGPLKGEGPIFVSLGGERMNSLRIPVGGKAHHVLFAHRLLESRIMEGDAVGRPVAKYVLHYAGGAKAEQEIRERFEIAIVPTPWGHRPFRALPDIKDMMLPRHQGHWGAIGQRQTEIAPSSPRTCYIWPWRNPDPDKVIETIEIVPAGPRFAIAAITLGHLEEEPFTRQGARETLIEIGDAAIADKPFDLDVNVDRGVAGYAWALPPSDENYMADPLRAWGEDQAGTNKKAYVEIAATPSATVRVKSGEEEIAAINWGELELKGSVQTPKARIEIVDGGRNWVHTTVVDDRTGEILPCRVHFRSAKGIPYAPHGHHPHVNSNMGSWHSDIGGDLRLGQSGYAYIDGKCQGWLPRGDVIADAACGFDYEPLRAKIEIKPGQRELTLRMKRLCDMNAERWFSGDTHVHFLSTTGAHKEAAGEGLNVVNLLASQWGHLFTNVEDLFGGPSVKHNGKTIVYASLENRQHLLGHISLLGLKEEVAPWCSDGPPEAEIGGHLEITLSRWADACRAQGGTVVIPHMPAPNGEPAALVATGRADAVEFLVNSPYQHIEYYRYLNAGYRMPLSGGTDKMSSDVPVGLYRTYVHIPENEEFNYDNWSKNLRAGRTFLSGGPLISLTVEGQPIGSMVKLGGKEGTVEVAADVRSIFPVGSLELVVNGAVVAATTDAKGAKALKLREKLNIRGHSWIAARCGAHEYLQPVPHRDSWRRGIMAHTSPIYVAAGGEWSKFDREVVQYLMTLVEGSVTHIRERSLHRPKGTVTHNHTMADHMEYLEEPFKQAMEALHKRLHEKGIKH